MWEEINRAKQAARGWDSLPEHAAPQIQAATHLRELGEPIPGIIAAAQAIQLPTDFPLPSFPAEGVWDRSCIDPTCCGHNGVVVR